MKTTELDNFVRKTRSQTACEQDLFRCGERTGKPVRALAFVCKVYKKCSLFRNVTLLLHEILKKRTVAQPWHNAGGICHRCCPEMTQYGPFLC